MQDTNKLEVYPATADDIGSAISSAYNSSRAWSTPGFEDHRHKGEVKRRQLQDPGDTDSAARLRIYPAGHFDNISRITSGA